MDRKRRRKSRFNLNTLVPAFQVTFKPLDGVAVEVVELKLIEKKVKIDDIKSSG